MIYACPPQSVDIISSLDALNIVEILEVDFVNWIFDAYGHRLALNAAIKHTKKSAMCKNQLHKNTPRTSLEAPRNRSLHAEMFPRDRET